MAKTAEIKNQLVESVLRVSYQKELSEITISDIAEYCNTPVVSLRMKFGSIDKILEDTALTCFETVLQPLVDAVHAKKNLEGCWISFRNSAVENQNMVRFYENYRETFNKGFENCTECKECEDYLFSNNNEKQYLWYHFIFDAKRAALKINKQMRTFGSSLKEAAAKSRTPNLLSTSMRLHVVSYSKLCSTI